MAFNGSGTFNRLYSWVTDAANGIFVRADRMDAEMDGMATGLSTCLTKDGQTTPTANIPMAGFKITGLGLGTANTDAASVQNLVNTSALHTCEFRITLTTATPVTTADVTGATTLYWSPYKGGRVALYDGSSTWNLRTSAELSITNAGLVASKPYDVFIYDNAGTPTIELLVWTNDATRATALTTQNGVLVKSGATTRRYVGTIYTTAGSAFTDSYSNRWVFNYYNRARRPMRVIEAANTWTYTVGTVRQANGNTANQLDFIVGVAEDAVVAEIGAFAQNSTVGVLMTVGVGFDTTTAFSSGGLFYYIGNGTANAWMAFYAKFKTIPAAGRHYMSWNEISAASGTTTWGGNAGNVSLYQSGIHGEVWA